MTGRRKPYTELGIRRLKCARRDCQNKARFQWRICSLDRWSPVCAECDIAINRQVLEFMGGPVESVIRRYEKTVWSQA